MVLSFLRTMPPSIEESMAFMAKNLAKLIALNTLHNEQLATSHAKLNLINKELAIANERLSALISNTVKPEKTMAEFLTASTSSITKIEKEINTQSQTSISVLPAPSNKPIHKMPKVRNEIVLLHPTKLYQTCVLATLVKDMLANFCCVKTFFVSHQCHPPKLVFLGIEPKPPWKLRVRRDSAMSLVSLEDKTRFQARSIDTCSKLQDPTWSNIIYEDNKCMNDERVVGFCMHLGRSG